MSMKKNIFSAVIMILIMVMTSKVSGQSADTLFGTSELTSILLPPINIFYDGLLNHPKQEQFDLKVEAEKRELKTERRKFLGNFYLYGIYQYGIAGVNSFMDLGSDYPIVYQNTGAEQLWYNVGVNFRISLDNFTNRSNKIKQQKLRVDIASKDAEILHIDQKIEISTYYYKVSEMIGSLKEAVELCAMSKAQYELAERDFIVGAISARELSVVKGMHVTNVIQLERIKAEMRAAISKLEILSGVKLIQ